MEHGQQTNTNLLSILDMGGAAGRLEGSTHCCISKGLGFQGLPGVPHQSQRNAILGILSTFCGCTHRKSAILTFSTCEYIYGNIHGKYM